MNVGENRGRRLKLALSRFAAMLIEEARDLTGFSYLQLDEKLGLPDGQAYRYSLYPITAKTRAPQAAGIQELENRVARLLKRAPHKIVVENNSKLAEGSLFSDSHVEDIVGGKLNLRDYDALDFQLGYEYDWPTYRRLKYDPEVLFCSGEKIFELIQLGAHNRWPEMLRTYAWQWGILWDRGLPWLSRSEFGISEKWDIEFVVAHLTAERMAAREKFRLAVLADGDGHLESFVLELYREMSDHDLVNS
jgi:hypothetical protein